MKTRTLLLFAVIILVAGFFAFFNNGIKHPAGEVARLQDSIRGLRKAVLYSEFKVARTKDTIRAINRALKASDSGRVAMEGKHAAYVASILKASHARLDSLMRQFYPDSVTRERDIVVTRIEKDGCDSVRNSLISEARLHRKKEQLQDSAMNELLTKAIPELKVIDSLHHKIEMNLTDQVKREKAKRFTIGPAINLGIDGSVRPGVAIGYAIFKF